MAERVIRITAGQVAAEGRLDAETWGDEIRAASGVNVVGRIAGDATVFKRVRAGTTIRVERA